MAEISKITLPSGSTYDIKDAEARRLIGELESQTDYLGVTTTELVDNETTNPIIAVAGESVTAVKGNTATYGSKEFIYNGTVWQEFGDLSGLGSLAYKNSASASYTPDGDVSQPTFTGTEGNVSVSGTPSGTVAVTVGEGTPNYTPTGTVSQPTTTVTMNTTNVNSITDVGTLPSCTLPSLSTSVANETLTLSWTDGSFSAGTLPTKGTDTVVATTVASATTTQPTFTGTGAELKATFTGEATQSTGTFTPTGSVSKPTFTGTEAAITVS